MDLSKIAVGLGLIVTVFVGTALAAPVTYTLEQGHIFVHFGYGHVGFSHQESRLNNLGGTVTFDPNAETGSVDVTGGLTSVDTGSALNKPIQGPLFFDTAHYPTAAFKSTLVNFDGSRSVSVGGNPTIKEITHTVTLKIDFEARLGGHILGS